MPRADEQTPPRPRRSWRRRWIPRLLVAIVTILLIVFVITEIVLRSTIPRQIVIAQVEKTLGLRVTAASLTTGWLGHTTLRNVQVSLPLSDRAFVSLPELRVRHTILPILLLTQSIDIKSIEMDRPVVTVTQDRFGRWNLQDVAAILLKLGGEGQAQQTPNKSSPLVLPAVSLIDGSIDITDNTNRHATLAPLDVTGTAVNSLVWKYAVHLDPPTGGHVALSGRIVPNDNFNHEVDFDLSQLASLAKPWLADFDPKALIRGNWHGSLADGGVSGRLLLQSLQYQNLAAKNGDFTVQAKNGAVTITPSSLIAQITNNVQTRLRITGGSIHADSAAARIDQLDLQALDGHIRVDGSLTFADLTASLTANWNDLTASRAISTTGSFTASLRPEWPDRHAITAHLSTSGVAAGAPYTADVQVAAAGKTWDAADATVTAPKLSVNWKTPVRLDGLVAHLASHRGEIDLTDVSLASNSTLSGAGAIKFDAATPSADHYDWWVYLLGQHIALPSIPNTDIHDQTVAFGLNAWGNQQQIWLKNTYGTIGEIIAMADGLYSFANPRPVDINVTVADTTALPATSPSATTSPSLVQGHVRGELELTGIAYPLDLSLSGQLHARGLIVGDRPLQDVDAKCTGIIDHEHMSFDTKELKLLGGQWKFHAQAPGRNQVPQATLTFHDLKLANVGDLLNQPDVTGTAAGEIDADFNVFTPEQILVDGHFSASDVRAWQLRIDTAAGTISLRNSELAISPIHLTQGNGHSDASIRLNVAHPTLIATTLNATGWPLDIAAAHADISARIDHLVIDAANRNATGRLTFSTDATYRAKPLATAKGSVDLAGQTATLDSFDAAALGGTASGTATFSLNSPLSSRAAFTWQGIDLNALSPYEERLRDASGSFSGKAILAQTNDSRAIAPLLLSIDAVGTHAHVGPVVFADAHLPIALDTDRAVLDGGTIDIADGTINLFARLSLHVDDTLSAQLNATLKRLDLDQLINTKSN